MILPLLLLLLGKKGLYIYDSSRPHFISLFLLLTTCVFKYLLEPPIRSVHALPGVRFQHSLMNDHFVKLLSYCYLLLPPSVLKLLCKVQWKVVHSAPMDIHGEEKSRMQVEYDRTGSACWIKVIKSDETDRIIELTPGRVPKLSSCYAAVTSHSNVWAFRCIPSVFDFFLAETPLRCSAHIA